MALKVRVALKIKGLDKLAARINGDFINAKVVKEIQNQVVDGQIKPFMRRGVSPVRGFGRYGEYVNPDTYPGDRARRAKLKAETGVDKAQRPVNLYLTGEMQNAIIARKQSSTSVGIGIFRSFLNGASKNVIIKAIANNMGTTTKNGTGAIPRRRFIPQPGEQWAVSVIRITKNIFTKRMKEILSGKK